MLLCIRTIIKKKIYIAVNQIRFYKTIIRPAVTFGAETCTLQNKIEKILMTWERKMLKKMYGPTKENGQWRTRTNLELKTKSKSQDIVTVIMIRRLEWIGYVIRMNETRSVKNIFQEKLVGKEVEDDTHSGG